MNNHKVKDEILFKLNETGGNFTIKRIKSQIEYSLEEVEIAFHQLIQDGLVKASSYKTSKGLEYSIMRNSAGIIFYKDGGYTKLNKQKYEEALKVSELERLNKIKVQTDITKNIGAIILVSASTLYGILDFIFQANGINITQRILEYLKF